MISDEINVYGFIKIPYPFLQDYLLKIDMLKQKNDYKNFPDFIMPPINCIENAMSTFGYIYRYEIDFENVLVDRFERFLNEIKFLFATLIIDIESKKYYFNEYVSDGSSVHKSKNEVIASQEISVL